MLQTALPDIPQFFTILICSQCVLLTFSKRNRMKNRYWGCLGEMSWPWLQLVQFNNQAAKTISPQYYQGKDAEETSFPLYKFHIWCQDCKTSGSLLAPFYFIVKSSSFLCDNAFCKGKHFPFSSLLRSLQLYFTRLVRCCTPLRNGSHLTWAEWDEVT